MLRDSTQASSELGICSFLGVEMLDLNAHIISRSLGLLVMSLSGFHLYKSIDRTAFTLIK